MLNREMRIIVFILILLFSFKTLNAQNFKTRNSYSGGNQVNQGGFFVGLAAGVYDMDGDYGSQQVGGVTPGYSLLAEYKIAPSFVLRGAITKGTLKEKFRGRFSYFDHHTEMSTMDFSLMYLFNSVTSCRRQFQIRPYIGMGLGLIRFETFADLYDNNGNRYFFWNDGTVRMGPEDNHDMQNYFPVKRDGVFETKVDSLGLYPDIAAIFPAEIGIRMMLSRALGFYLSAKYTLTSTDYIDHGVAYGDSYLTDRARKNRFSDGYYSYTLGVVFRLEPEFNRKRSNYSRKYRRPKMCRTF